MTRRKLFPLAAVALTGLALGAWWLWPRNVYRYQGKTVEAWFSETADNFLLDSQSKEERSDKLDKVRVAFQEMGTNAAPFLASRINRDLKPTLLERLVSKMPTHWQPRSRNRDFDSFVASDILRHWVTAPDIMLREMLKPALLGTNENQKGAAESALKKDT